MLTSFKVFEMHDDCDGGTVFGADFLVTWYEPMRITVEMLG
jgi:hypothetical protein